MNKSIYDNIKKLAIFFISALSVIGIIYFLDKNSSDIGPALQQIESSLNEDIISKINREISAPTPLINNNGASDQAYLTKKGVLYWTNIARKDNGSLPPLAENITLDKIAEERLNDLFAKQYFEHISPEGIGAADIAEKLEYQFIAIGENLALGNFKDDHAVTDAWMASPGHRANILNANYQEIGISVKKGTYQNRETWIGVQIFARPLSACPQPDSSLKARIDISQDRISQMEKTVETLKAEISAMHPKNKNELLLYNQKIDEYNFQITKINNLIRELKSMIAEHNADVDALNKCISQ